MTTLIPNKKTGHLSRRNGESSSFVSDNGSLRGISTFSDGGIIRYNKRKTRKSSKDCSTAKLKFTPNRSPNSARHSTSKSEHYRKIRSISSHIVMSPLFLSNQTNKKYNGTAKEKTQTKNTAKLTIAKQKNTSHKTKDDIVRESNISTTISDFNNSLHYSENTLNILGKCHSLLDLRDCRNNDIIFPQTSFRQRTFSVTSSETLNFKKMSSGHRKNHFDYLKEFDFIRYSGTSKETAKLSDKEGIFSLLPKISPSEPITLSRKQYSVGTVSMSDCEDVSRRRERKCKEKDLNETKIRIENENRDVGLPPEKLEVRGCLGDSDDAQLTNRDVLFEKKPLRIRCTDEASNKTKDLIIYSEDFLKELLRDRGNSASKKELYESIVKESTDYKGKSLRIITDAEKYICNLHNKRKPRGNIKSTTDRIPKQIPTKVSRNSVPIEKNGSNIPHCSKSCETPMKANAETITEQNDLLKEDILNESVESFTQTDEDSHHTKIKTSKSMEILKREAEKFETQNKGKSRTVLKKINFENIIASSFSYYFHFFAKLGLPLKSGATISKKNSTKWLKECGVVYDNASKNMAENCFETVANAKCVLNMCDYVKCLNKIARNRKMLLVDMLCRMMSIDLHSIAESIAKKMESQREKPTEEHPTPEDKEEKSESKEDESCIEII